MKTIIIKQNGNEVIDKDIRFRVIRTVNGKVRVDRVTFGT